MRRGVSRDAALRAAARQAESMWSDWIAQRKPGAAVRAWGTARDRRSAATPGSGQFPGAAFYRYGETTTGRPMLSGYVYSWARSWDA
jgi:hypothetical protein